MDHDSRLMDTKRRRITTVDSQTLTSSLTLAAEVRFNFRCLPRLSSPLACTHLFQLTLLSGLLAAGMVLPTLYGRHVCPRGPGQPLLALGKATCYANAAAQCFVHTPTIANLKRQDWCIACGCNPTFQGLLYPVLSQHPS